MQAFFDAIDITTVFTGDQAYYMPPVDKVYMPSITRFEDPRRFYGVWAHELAHNAEVWIMPRRSAQPVTLRSDRRGVSA